MANMVDRCCWAGDDFIVRLTRNQYAALEFRTGLSDDELAVEKELENIIKDKLGD